jgi:circadian clock protein KaiB
VELIPKERPQKSSKTSLEVAELKRDSDVFVLDLYVSGCTPRSRIVIETVKKICTQNLKGRCKLDIIDIKKHPDRLRTEQIFASPTLIKKFPPPLIRIVGEMSNSKHLLERLEVK